MGEDFSDNFVQDTYKKQLLLDLMLNYNLVPAVNFNTRNTQLPLQCIY